MGRATKEVKRRRRRRGLFIFEVIVLLILIAVLFVYAKLNGAIGRITGHEINEENVGTNEGIDHETLKGYTNIALVGIDTRTDGDGLRNSDAMIIASINNDTKEVKLVSVYRDTYVNVGNDKYDRANAAYAKGGAEQFLTMLNKNLDMNIMDYVTVNFQSMVAAIDILGGMNLYLTASEIVHLNNYCVEVSKVTGEGYDKLPEADGYYDVNGVQAVAYARIRYGGGEDFRRAARQRLVISKMVEKAKKASIGELNRLLNEVFQPEMISSSLTQAEVFKMGTSMLSYEIKDDGQVGFPFDHLYGQRIENAIGIDAVLPVTLETNVRKLHEFLYPELTYEPSDTVKEYSNYIINKSGYGEESIPSESETGAIPPPAE
jgi:cell envelope-related function transcriptional attenuator common domain